MKVKIFMDSCPDELEQKVNQWLAANPIAEVVQLTTHFESVLKTSGAGTSFWEGMSYLTLLYRDTD